jgi:hypothetical protein
MKGEAILPVMMFEKGWQVITTKCGVVIGFTIQYYNDKWEEVEPPPMSWLYTDTKIDTLRWRRK